MPMRRSLMLAKTVQKATKYKHRIPVLSNVPDGLHKHRWLDSNRSCLKEKQLEVIWKRVFVLKKVRDVCSNLEYFGCAYIRIYSHIFFATGIFFKWFIALFVVDVINSNEVSLSL